MIEMLGSETASLDRDDPVTPVLTITNITFAGGDLSRPRYGSLIDHSRAPAGVQFEPCLQIRDPELAGEMFKIRFEIDSNAGVRFVSNALEEVRVSSIVAPESFSPPGLLSARLVGGDPRKCDLVWKQSDADSAGFSRLNTLRLFCEFEDGRSPSNVEVVEGGLYVSILKRAEDLFLNPARKSPGEPVPETIKMLGFDDIGRPRYDLFLPQDSLPAAFVVEPAFRCREGQIVSFALALDLPPEIDIEFVREPPPNDDQVGVVGFLPEGHPFQLFRTTVGDFGGKSRRKSSLIWTQETGRQYCATSNPEEAKRCYCIHGQNSSFGLRAAPGGVVPSQRGKMAEVDPTVIQPPSCTSQGICITP
jgi:hypothetical protein